MRVLLAGNPASGSGRGAAAIERAARGLRELGASVDVLRSEGPGHVRRALSEGVPHERVIACGGDGVVSEAAAALRGTGVPLAVVPAGRGNDLARALSLPRGTVAAVKLALSGTPRPMDLGLANGRAFCTVAACGLDAEVSRMARASVLPLPGPGVYLVELLRALRRPPAFAARLEHDGGVFEDELLVLAVANTATYGGGFRIAPDARPDDGLLDVVAIRTRSRLQALALVPRVMRGTHLTLGGVTVFRTRRLVAKLSPDAAIEGDGEPLAASPVTYEVDPGALMVVGP